MGDITRTMPTPKTTYVDLTWPMTAPTQFSTLIPWAPGEVPGRRVIDPPRYNGDGSYTYSVRYVRDDEKPIDPVDTTPANRHERRQASSRKHQRAALHGAGDQKRIAVERRGE